MLWRRKVVHHLFSLHVTANHELLSYTSFLCLCCRRCCRTTLSSSPHSKLNPCHRACHCNKLDRTVSKIVCTSTTHPLQHARCNLSSHCGPRAVLVFHKLCILLTCDAGFRRLLEHRHLTRMGCKRLEIASCSSTWGSIGATTSTASSSSSSGGITRFRWRVFGIWLTLIKINISSLSLLPGEQVRDRVHRSLPFQW